MGIRQGQTARTIQRIADKRVARGCQMDPDLVRAARLDTYVAEKGIHAAFDNGYV
jgi:hypothetical protein